MKTLLKKIAASFKTRSTRVGGYSVAAGCIVLAIAVAANAFVSALPSSVTKIDTTTNQLFTISEQTEDIVSRLQSDVTIYWIVQSGSEDTGVKNLLERYEDLSDRVEVKKIDPDVYPTFLDQYSLSNVYNNSLVVECGDRYRYVSEDEIYVYDYSYYYYTGSYDVSFDGESALTSAIDYVVSEDLPKVYVLTGHGESTLATTFSTAVEKENIELADLSLLTEGEVPADGDCLLICCPQSDISSEELEMIRDYLGNGGNMILITDPPVDGALENLDALMAYYGVTAQEGIVVEGNQSHYAYGTPYYLLPEIESHTITQPLIDEGYYILMPVAQGLTVSDEKPVTVSVTKLLTTSSSAFSKAAGYSLTTYEREDGDIAGPFALAVAITDTLEDGIESNILWFASGALLDEQTNSQVSGGNQDLFLNALSYLCESEGSSISIHAKSLSYDYLTMDSGTASSLSILVVAVIPLMYLAVGIVVVVRRKRR